jgi:hypothetical protein
MIPKDTKSSKIGGAGGGEVYIRGGDNSKMKNVKFLKIEKKCS